MEDELVEAVKGLKPRAVSRDAILFQAGVAAGRNARPWQWATATLGVAGIALMVVPFRGRDAEPDFVELMRPAVPMPVESKPIPLEPYSLISLMQRGEVPAVVPPDRGVPADRSVPLRSGMRSLDDGI